MRCFVALLLIGCGHYNAPAPATPEAVPDTAAREPATSTESVENPPSPSTGEPTPSEAPPAFVLGPIDRRDRGTPHPLLVQGLSPDGRWVAACQARVDTDGNGRVEVLAGHHGDMYGDELRSYIMFDTGDELAVDGFAGSDGMGRYLAFFQNEELVIFDSHTRSEVHLGQRDLATDDPNPSMRPRAIHFDKAGRRLVYLAGPQERETVVVRELASGEETTLNTGDGRMWRAQLLGDGSWLAVAMVTEDTNGNGRLDLPEQRTSLGAAACRGPVTSYSTGGFRGDAFMWRAMRIRDSRWFDGSIVGDGDDVVLLKNADGSLRWLSDDGTDATIVPAHCAPEVHSFWAPSTTVIVACGASTPAPMRAYTFEGAYDLGVTADDVPMRDAAAHGRIHPLGTSHLVHLERHAAYPRAYRGELGIWEDRVLETTRQGVVQIRDLANGAVRSLTGQTDTYVYGEQFGRWSAVQHAGEAVLVVDLQQGRSVGRLSSIPILIDDSGMALTTAEVRRQVPFGPLRWEQPERRPRR